MMMVDSLDYGGEGGLVIGRGDSPALAVLDRNARSLAQRVADETKEELEKVLKRVENIYGNFEVSNNLLESTRAANLEYVNDVAELEELIRDQVKKKKYQQQVTIFIVGFENVCGQKLRLLQQVNEFFMDNAQKLDDDDIRIKSPDLDLDDMAETVEETLKTTEDLAKRLGELNKEMMEYMYNYAQAKASNKRGKKKLEKALTQAKDDINTLNEKLLNLQQEIEEKEDKMQQMFKQVEMKNMEVQRYKTAAEVAKKSHEETDKLREEISVRDEKIKVLIKEIEKLQQELALSHHTKERSQERLLGAREESNTKLEQLQQSIQDQTLLAEEAKRDEDEVEPENDLARLHKKQIDGLETAHKEEIVQLQLQHNEEIKKLLGEEASKAALYEIDGQGSLSTDSRSKKVGKKVKISARHCKKESKASSVKPVSRHETRSSTKSVSRKPSGASSTVRQESRQQNQEEAEVAPGVEPERPREEPVKPPAQPPLVPVTEDEILEFDNVYPLEDEEAWAHVPPEEVRGRFGQYRKLSQQELDKLREQVDTTIKRASKKINTLKGQFQEHKAKWDSERLLLKSQIQQVSKLQNAAENEADKAMNQLEDFINEQEKLEVEEEEKRKALEQMAKVAAGSKSEAAGRDGAAKTEDAASAPIVEHEAMQQRLLEQTDDAKQARQRSMCGHGGEAVRSVSTSSIPRNSPIKTPGSSEYKPKTVLPSPVSPRKQDNIRATSARTSLSRNTTFVSPSPSPVRSKDSRKGRLSRRFTTPVPNVPSSVDSIKRESAISSESAEQSSSGCAPITFGPGQNIGSVGKYTDHIWDSSYLEEAYPYSYTRKGDLSKASKIETYSFSPVVPEQCINYINSNYFPSRRSKSLDDRTYVAYQRTKLHRYNPQPKSRGLSRARRPVSTQSEPPQALSRAPLTQHPGTLVRQMEMSRKASAKQVTSDTQTDEQTRTESDTSVESRKPSRSSILSGSAQSKRRSVTFAEEIESLDGNILNIEETKVLHSIKTMMEAWHEGGLFKAQHTALKAVRETLMQGNFPSIAQSQTLSKHLNNLDNSSNRSFIIYTLLSHMSHESVAMGVEPSSLMYALADLMDVTTLLLNDFEREKSDLMMFTLPETPRPEISLKKVHQEIDTGTEANLGNTAEGIRASSARSRASLRSQQRSALNAMRTAQEERRTITRTPTHHSINKSSLTDAELDEDGDMPFPKDKPALTLDKVSSSHDIGTSMSHHEQSTSPMTPQPLPTKAPSLHDDLASRSNSSLVNKSTMITASTSPASSPQIQKAGYSSLPVRPALKPASLDTSQSRPPRVEAATTVTETGDGNLAVTRDGIAMADHPVVEEYIKTYENIVNFKDVLAKTFLERDLMSPGSVLSDIEPVPFHKDNTVQPQLELMTCSVQKILQEILNLVKNILAADRDYPVSSLNLSREQTRLTRFTPDSAYGGGGTQARKTATPGVPEPDPKTQQQIEELQKMCKMMEKNLNTESKKYEERLQHNTVVMMEMQDTINALQRELSALKAAQERQAAQEIPEDSPIMFTRLDSERNAKVMKRALNERRLSYETYETAVRSMSNYVSLPAKRLAHLVTKYVHHRQMKEIEERVQKSRSVDQDVFHVLDKMEMLQSVRAHRWADRMDAIGAERLRLAAVLMETLGEIERESGIFLIKPVFSYKPRYDPDKYDGKISRRFKPAQDGAGLVQQATSTTTPASHIRTVQQLQNQSLPSDLYSQIQREEESNIIEGKTKNLIGEYPKPVWQPSAAITHQANENNTHRFNSHLNTPKMLELDINRMLIGQNQIMMRTTPGMESDDRLANAANQTTRSYITVHRPSGHPTAVPATRPRSHPGGADPSVPPTTPYTKSLPSSAGRKARVPEDGGARPLNSTPPLPPITPTLERPLSREENICHCSK